MNEWTIGVVGVGSMGRGIAQVAATHGHKVLIYDKNKEAINEAAEFLRHILNRQVEKGRMQDEDVQLILSRIIFVENIGDLGACQLIIEAIVEDIEVKRTIFQLLEEITDSGTILASNTSSLSITAIASACENPENILGMHFFNPAPLMQLVELIPAAQTRDATLSKASHLIRNWQKFPVIAKDTPGFIVNRIARPFYSEALRLYDEGIAEPADIDYAMTSVGGFKMGPFTLMDYIGNDINFKVTNIIYNAFYQEPRYKPSFAQKRLVDAGWLGKKTGRGFYDYSESDVKPAPTADEGTLENIFTRIIIMLINEAADALYYNIANEEDIETAMTKGVNYPKGLLHWADELGIDTVVEQLDQLYEFYHEERFRVSPMLRAKAKFQQTFF